MFLEVQGSFYFFFQIILEFYKIKVSSQSMLSLLIMQLFPDNLDVGEQPSQMGGGLKWQMTLDSLGKPKRARSEPSHPTLNALEFIWYFPGESCQSGKIPAL